MTAKTNNYGDPFIADLTIPIRLDETGVFEMTFYVLLACADLDCNITNEDSIDVLVNGRSLAVITYENIDILRVWTRMSVEFESSDLNIVVFEDYF